MGSKMSYVSANSRRDFQDLHSLGGGLNKGIFRVYLGSPALPPPQPPIVHRLPPQSSSPYQRPNSAHVALFVRTRDGGESEKRPLLPLPPRAVLGQVALKGNQKEYQENQTLGVQVAFSCPFQDGFGRSDSGPEFLSSTRFEGDGTKVNGVSTPKHPRPFKMGSPFGFPFQVPENAGKLPFSFLGERETKRTPSNLEFPYWTCHMFLGDPHKLVAFLLAFLKKHTPISSLPEWIRQTN